MSREVENDTPKNSLAVKIEETNHEDVNSMTLIQTNTNSTYVLELNY